MTSLPAEFFWDPSFEMGPESAALAEQVWPNFLAQESDLPRPGLTLEISEAEFLRRYPSWGLRSTADRRLVGYANAVQVYCDLDGDLPDGGWEFAIEAGGFDRTPNCLCLVVANVDPSAQHRGLSYHLIERAKLECRALGLGTLIAPVRPSHKHERPELTMEEYVAQNTDPWLRAHERCGGRRRNICRRSAIVTAGLGLWSTWTGETYPVSGSYPLKRGLAPLLVDVEKDLGTYTEPNVWYVYHLD